MNELDIFIKENWLLFSILTIWTTFWKGLALWIASKNEHRKWFVAFLFLNTVGILEIIYIFFITKKQYSDLKDILAGKN